MRPMYPKAPDGQRAFTVLELLLALFLTSLLVLLVYQVYSQVLLDYRRLQNDPLPTFWRITESLARGLEELDCQPVWQGRPLPRLEDGRLFFLTRYSPGGSLLVVFGPDLEGQGGLYGEWPYVAGKLPEELTELLRKDQKALYRLPSLKLRLLAVRDDGEEEEVEEFSPGGLWHLEVLGPGGLRRDLYFRGCP